jgi:hypothetical protein
MAITTTITTQLTCDRDGATASTTSPAPTLPEGWLAVVVTDGPTMGASLHYCPACAAGLRESMKSTQGGSS